MQTSERLFPEAISQKIWLNYYNDYLLEHGVITEIEWRKMRTLIEQR